MNIKSVLIGFSAIGVVALSGLASNAVSARGAQAANAADQSLLVDQFFSGDTLLHKKHRNQYNSFSHAHRVRIFNRFTGVSFTNTASQPIRTVTFDLYAYGDTYAPVLDPAGEPVVKQLVADGPFQPGSKYTLANSNVVWSLPSGDSLGCVLLKGMHISFADGTTMDVGQGDVSRYLSPHLANHCGVGASGLAASVSGWNGAAPYLVDLHPTRWMALHEYQLLRNQPFVAPGTAQHLCATGSAVEETCGVAPAY